jgi:5-methylcytosine-specific restriction endonuclease McrA
METFPSFSTLTDAELLVEAIRLAQNERAATVSLIGVLAELDDRRLYLAESCSSLYIYCRTTLRLSEHAAYHRITAARTGRRFPLALQMFAAGDLTLTAITQLAPYLTLENHADLLSEARGKSTRDVAAIVARLNPRPPITATVVPLAPGLYKLQCSITQAGHDDLQSAQNLLRHVIPSGDIGLIIERALSTLVRDVTKHKSGIGANPRPAVLRTRDTRYLPLHVRREVWQRDEGRCAFVGDRGRCEERGFLEYHHVVPYAAGGQPTVANLQLRCRAHNAYEAELYLAEEAPPTRREPSEETASNSPAAAVG